MTAAKRSLSDYAATTPVQPEVEAAMLPYLVAFTANLQRAFTAARRPGAPLRRPGRRWRRYCRREPLRNALHQRRPTKPITTDLEGVASLIAAGATTSLPSSGLSTNAVLECCRFLETPGLYDIVSACGHILVCVEPGRCGEGAPARRPIPGVYSCCQQRGGRS
jgi:cysteine sulfinate desulfinase/cysteine desulfurase-like protein